MRGDRDEADGALGFQRAELFDHTRRWQAKTALAQHFERDEIALDRAVLHAARNEYLARDAALFDRQSATAAAFEFAVHAKHARPDLFENFDDAPAVGGLARAGVGIEFDAQEDSRPDAGGKAALAFSPRIGNDDARSFSGLSPFAWRGDEVAVAVALDDVGGDEGRQAALHAQGLAAARDGAVGFKVLDQQLERVAVVALDVESARYLALGDARWRSRAFGRSFAGNERQHLLTRWQRARRRRARRDGAGRARRFNSFGQLDGWNQLE